MGDVMDLGTSDSTFEIIGNATDANNYPMWLKKYTTATGAGYIFYTYAFTNPGQRCQYQDNSDSFQPSINGNYTSFDWVYVTSCRWNSINGEIVATLNNRGTASNGDTGDVSNGDSFYLARNEFGGTGMKGRLDEVRITVGLRRNSSWLNYTWLNLNKTDSVNFSGAESKPAGYPELISIDYMSNNTENLCPCDGALWINATMSNGSKYNVSIYIRMNQTTTFWMIENISNITANTSYIFCLCSIYDAYNGSHPLAYHRTYNWYFNVSKYNNDTVYNQSNILSFSTPISNSTCEGTSSSSTTTSVQITFTDIEGIFGLGGLIGIIGILGYLRRKKK